MQWRARAREERSTTDPVEPLRLGEPLSQLPWQMAQEEFGIAGADFLGQLGRSILANAKDEIRSQVKEINQEFDKVEPVAAKDEIRS